MTEFSSLKIHMFAQTWMMFSLSLWNSENIIRVNLIYCYRLWFAEKKSREKNPDIRYTIAVCIQIHYVFWISLTFYVGVLSCFQVTRIVRMFWLMSISNVIITLQYRESLIWKRMLSQMLLDDSPSIPLHVSIQESIIPKLKSAETYRKHIQTQWTLDNADI